MARSLTRAHPGALGLLVALIAAAAPFLAPAPAAHATTCHLPGVKHLGSGETTINVLACRALASQGLQREYGQVFIGRRATTAQGCSLRMYTQYRTRAGKITTYKPGGIFNCAHVLRRSHTVTFWGPVRIITGADVVNNRTLVELRLRHGDKWSSPISAASGWMNV
jgi:hypothetical protein